MTSKARVYTTNSDGLHFLSGKISTVTAWTRATVVIKNDSTAVVKSGGRTYVLLNRRQAPSKNTLVVLGGNVYLITNVKRANSPLTPKLRRN